MEYLKVGQRVRLPCLLVEGTHIDGEIVGMGQQWDDKSAHMVYLVRLDEEFRGYIAQHNGEKQNNYISTIVAHSDGVEAL